MSSFTACLVAMSRLQMRTLWLIMLTKDKFPTVSLMCCSALATTSRSASTVGAPSSDTAAPPASGAHEGFIAVSGCAIMWLHDAMSLRSAAQVNTEAVTMSTRGLRHPSIAPWAFRTLTLGNWMFDAIAELTKNGPAAAARESRPVSRFVPANAFSTNASEDKKYRRRTLHIAVPEVDVPALLPTASSNQFSLQFTPISPTLCSTPRSFAQSMVEDNEAFEE